MGNLVWAELKKNRRNLWLAVLPLAMALAVADSRYVATARDGVTYDWPLVVSNTIFLAATYLLPACLTLQLTQSMQAERDNRTLPCLLVLPMSFRRLLAGKLLAEGIWLAAASVLEWLIALAVFPCTGIPGLSPAGAATALAAMLSANLWTYLALLPLLALAAQWPGSGTAALVAFFWGALGGLLSNRSLFLHLNPLSAGTALWRWEAGRGLFFDSSRLGLSLSGLAVAVALGVLAVAAARDRASARHRGKRRRRGRP